uniref:Tr-type G domain-containing protein n=1 Tax=Chromera velia CCMP2878 TaxID=1169474 RepID=A0A0G4FNL3_9ALVE
MSDSDRIRPDDQCSPSLPDCESLDASSSTVAHQGFPPMDEPVSLEESGKAEEGPGKSMDETGKENHSAETEEGIAAAYAEMDEHDEWSLGGELEGLSEDIKVAVIGNVDSGKSTLVGVLTKSCLDDGRGLARGKVFNFVHEQANGRTSSIAQEIIGFHQDGSQVQTDHGGGSSSSAAAVTAASRNNTWGTIVKNAARIITFMDLCGHERYLKTTIFGLVGLCPDYAMIVVGANMGVQRMTREHLGIALALKVPFFVVLTKVDIAPENVYKQSVAQLQKILKGTAAKKLPLMVKDENDIEAAASSIACDRVCPIFSVSNVTGEGLDLVRKFLFKIANRLRESGNFRPPTDPAEFHIDGVYQVTGVGVVVAGTMKAGTIQNNSQLLLGPDKSGNFKPVLVRSVHSKRVPVPKVVSGQAASFALRSLMKKDTLKRAAFRKGMVLLDRGIQPKATWEFEAEVVILHHATTIKERYQAVIHCGVIRQAAQVKCLSGDLLRTGDKGRIRFRFMYNAEYLVLDLPLLFREGRTKGLGRISNLFHDA